MLKLLGIRSSRGTRFAVNIVLMTLVWWYLSGLELGSSYAFMVSALPYWCLVSLGCYALASIGYKLWVLEDCVQAAAELQEEIKQAKTDLTKRGFRFDVGK